MRITEVGAPKTSDGRPVIATGKGDATRRQIYTHDWTDKTTWFSSAVRVVAAPATFFSGATWKLPHKDLIDSYHGKLFGEDYLRDANGNAYRVGVTVGGAAKIECDPHDNVGDYVVNYAAGTITFSSAPASSASVLVTYHYAVDSSFSVAPNPGKRLTIDVVEVQFSADIVIADTARFQVWVYAPAAVCTAMGWPLGTKVPYGDAAVYKTMRNYLDDAMRAYPPYSAIGGNGWRGMSQPVVIFDWDYLASIPLNSSAGAEIRVSLDHNTPFVGAYATASFYCTEADE